MDKKEYYKQNREHILMMHKRWRDAHQKTYVHDELVYCCVCKMMFPIRRLEKHKLSAMHLKELDDYKRLHQQG